MRSEDDFEQAAFQKWEDYLNMSASLDAAVYMDEKYYKESRDAFRTMAVELRKELAEAEEKIAEQNHEYQTVVNSRDYFRHEAAGYQQLARQRLREADIAKAELRNELAKAEAKIEELMRQVQAADRRYGKGFDEGKKWMQSTLKDRLVNAFREGLDDNL
jgi:chromosome segregation ATPase